MKRWCVFFILILMLLPTLALADGAQDGAAAEKKLEVEDISIELGVILNIRIREQNCQMTSESVSTNSVHANRYLLCWWHHQVCCLSSGCQDPLQRK